MCLHFPPRSPVLAPELLSLFWVLYDFIWTLAFLVLFTLKYHWDFYWYYIIFVYCFGEMDVFTIFSPLMYMNIFPSLLLVSLFLNNSVVLSCWLNPEEADYISATIFWNPGQKEAGILLCRRGKSEFWALICGSRQGNRLWDESDQILVYSIL